MMMRGQSGKIPSVRCRIISSSREMNKTIITEKFNMFEPSMEPSIINRNLCIKTKTWNFQSINELYVSMLLNMLILADLFYLLSMNEMCCGDLLYSLFQPPVFIAIPAHIQNLKAPSQKVINRHNAPVSCDTLRYPESRTGGLKTYICMAYLERKSQKRKHPITS